MEPLMIYRSKNAKNNTHINGTPLQIKTSTYFLATFLAVISLGRSRAVRRRHCVGDGAPVNLGRRGLAAGPKNRGRGAAPRGVGGQNSFSKIHEKISFYPQNFLRTFFS